MHSEILFNFDCIEMELLKFHLGDVPLCYGKSAQPIQLQCSPCPQTTVVPCNEILYYDSLMGNLLVVSKDHGPLV